MANDMMLQLKRAGAASAVDFARAQGYRPRVHPNGFVQLDLEVSPDRQHRKSDRRLHIWPELGRITKQATDHTIHDHVFDMKSTILYGTLGQELYGFDLAHEGDPTHEIYMANYSCRHSSELAGTGVLARQRGRSTEWVGVGRSYTQAAFTFHDTVCHDEARPVVTVMDKVEVYDGTPRVMVPIDMGAPVDNDFDRLSADEKELWAIIDESMDLISG